jgi:Na+-driven multidrug efflux pump
MKLQELQERHYAQRSVVESLALYFWLYFFVVTVSLQFLAVLEGQGRAQVQSGIFLLGGWAVGVPLAIASMKLTHFGLPALWASLLIGDVVTAIFGAFFVWRSNWSLLAEEATYRQEEDQ